MPNLETKKTEGTETGEEIAAEVETVDGIVKGKLKDESHLEVEPMEGEVLIEVRPEMRTGAGALEARVIKESLVKTHHAGRIKNENLGTTNGDIAAAAAALTAIEKGKRPGRALIASPKTKGAQKSKSLTVLEAEITIKDIVLLAQVLTATDMACCCKNNSFFCIPYCSISFLFNLVLLTRASNCVKTLQNVL